MLALMVDSYFKSLWVVERFMGCGNANHFTIEYDIKELILGIPKFQIEIEKNV
jgi:hypothetical protein